MEGEWIDQKKQTAFKEQQTKSPDPNNTQWRSDTSGFGFQMLMKMGWKEGNGLGKNQQGDPTVLKTLKQFDTTGLGVEKTKPSANNWLETKASFDDLLKRLNSEVLPVDEPLVSDDDKKKKRKRRDEKEKSEKKKKRKTESSSSEQETEKTEKTQDAEKILKSTRVLYPKRTASKMISLYSENDMNQILGHGAKLFSRPSEEVKAINEEKEKEKESSSSSSSEEEEEQKQEKKKKKKKDKKEKDRKEKKEKKDKKEKKNKKEKKDKKDKKKKKKRDKKEADQADEEE